MCCLWSTERLAATNSSLEALQAAHEEANSALSGLREENAAVGAAKGQLEAEAEQLRTTLQVRRPRPRDARWQRCTGPGRICSPVQALVQLWLPVILCPR